jgi:4a-hydroxytetrahydrobiopterin dehydratase
MDLASKKCVACEGGVPPLTEKESQAYLSQTLGWELLEGIKIKKKFIFKNFKQAMAFVNNVAGIAESGGHHPDIYIFYNKVTLEFWTHAIGGLSENDFIMAAKVNKL